MFIDLVALTPWARKPLIVSALTADMTDDELFVFAAGISQEPRCKGYGLARIASKELG
jgi:hypothetical protein